MELFNSANDELKPVEHVTATMDYSAVFHRVEDFVQSRQGIYRDPGTTKKGSLFKHKNNLTVRDITGGLCYCAYKFNLSTDSVISFLDKVQDNVINEIPDHKIVNFDDLLPMSIRSHPMYIATQQFLPYATPGTGQIGPGEFQFCFFDKTSHYILDVTVEYDVMLTPSNNRVEIKKDGTALTCSPEKIEEYRQLQEQDRLDRFMVYKPISNKSLNPRSTSQFVSIDLMNQDWREFLDYASHQVNPSLYIRRDLL